MEGSQGTWPGKSLTIRSDPNRASTRARPRSVVVDNPAHIHDLNATILHCLGIDHLRPSFKFQGLDMRLMGVEEHSPIKGILV